MTDPTRSTIFLPASAFSPGEMYLLLRDSVLPRPVAWVSTISAGGITNVPPFSFFNVCCPAPAVLGFSCGRRGDNHDETVVSKRTPSETSGRPASSW